MASQRRTGSCLLLLFCWVGSCLILPTATLAQTRSCNTVIANFNQAVNECSEINTNWVCYGSSAAEAAPAKYRFFQTRDRRPFSVLEQIQTVDNNGVVLMNLQPMLEATAVKVAVFGAAQVSTGATSTIMTLSVDQSAGYLCTDTPPGMVVRTETGETGVVTVNGVDIELGSTVFITLLPDQSMVLVNVEGKIKVSLAGQSVLLPVGYQVLVENLADGGRTLGEPTPSTFAASVVLRWLAENGLRRIVNSNETDQACLGEIEFGETITAQNANSGHECLYQFCGKAGDIVSVNMAALDPALNPWLDLRGPGGWLVSFNDDIAGDELDSLICNRVLPLTSCDYTIVARSTRNASAGLFTLALDHRTACTQPELRCRVVEPRGASLRRGPGENYPVLRTLPQGQPVHPLERTADGQWALVEVGNTQQSGWVNQQPTTLECEDDGQLIVVGTPPSEQKPAAPSEPEKKKTPTPPPCQEKCSPEPGP